MKSNPIFFIFGYFGWFNIGDDAIGLSVIKELKHRYPKATFMVTCNDQYFVDNFQGIDISGDLETVGFGISSILREIIKSDYFIITGGTHFHDEDELKFRRFKILLSFVILTCYARLLGKSPLLLGHGIGPLSCLWSKTLVKVILYNSKKVFVRDGDSFALVASLGFSEKCVQGFDCTTTQIQTISTINGLSKRSYNQKIIGISLLPVYSIYSNDVERDANMVKSFAKCLESLLQKDNSINIRLYAFRTGTKHSDVTLLEALMKNLNVKLGAVELIQYDGNVTKFLNYMKECNFFIGMRYHASVFAYLLNKPQIILDYMGKCKSLAHDINIDDTAIIPISEIVNPEFCKKIESLLISPSKYLPNLPVSEAKMRAKEMFEKFGEEL